MDKENSGFLTQLVFYAKFQKQELQMLKSLFKLFATLGKKKRVWLKQGCDGTNKWKQNISSLYHQMLQAIKLNHYEVYYQSRVDKAFRNIWKNLIFLVSFLKNNVANIKPVLISKTK